MNNTQHLVLRKDPNTIREMSEHLYKLKEKRRQFDLEQQRIARSLFTCVFSNGGDPLFKPREEPF